MVVQSWMKYGLSIHEFHLLMSATDILEDYTPFRELKNGKGYLQISLQTRPQNHPHGNSQ